MKHIYFLFIYLYLLSISNYCKAQNATSDTTALKIYRGTPTRINDLVHTKLDLSFDYDSCYSYGKAWITLNPHFYATDSLTLDARGMDIKNVCLMKNGASFPLKYMYDGWLLNIKLNKQYNHSELYTVYINYIAKPNEIPNTFTRGLYFVNPKGTEKNRPTQIWTHGALESGSAWFPTIDKPNQKSTEEIFLTVRSKYVTMSNGKLISKKNNGNGTRTDHWVMDLPNAPYLFFFGVGNYAIVKDQYKGMEVDYYVDKEYEKQARRTFGSTPQMIGFIEHTLGVKYPWVKYDQITAVDIPFSMENTSCTLHGYHAQLDARELSEGVGFEIGLCHELFHQWFGDLVTAESWSNLTLNESFANLSETLWATYKEGENAGDAVNYWAMKGYFGDSAADSKNLVRFSYPDKYEMLDYSVTYLKGGRILNMLKNYVGDRSFYKALRLYLNTKKFKSAEAQDLRLAFEEVTGQDLNWYWNQWYYGSGHPRFIIDYKYDDAAGKSSIIIHQTQNTGKIFRIPLAIDIYEGTVKKRYPVWIQNEVDTFTFSYKQRPALINVDGDKIILCEKQDNKTLENFIFQYNHAGLFVDRMEAIDFCAKHQDDPMAIDLLKQALKDPVGDVRKLAIEKLNLKNENIKTAFISSIVNMAASDPNSGVRGQAILSLGNIKNSDYKAIFIKAARDSSYNVAGSGLEALDLIDSSAALSVAKQLGAEPSKNKLSMVIINLLTRHGDERYANLVIGKFGMLNIEQKMEIVSSYIKYLSAVKNSASVRMAVDQIIWVRQFFPEVGFEEIIKNINTSLKAMADQKAMEGFREQADYINLNLK